ncbi:hypothetical protein L1887_20498 [Cichorium endivia]|nr:hypothetical protein L1887_20498 [Cichorium endivia]
MVGWFLSLKDKDDDNSKEEAFATKDIQIKAVLGSNSHGSILIPPSIYVNLNQRLNVNAGFKEDGLLVYGGGTDFRQQSLVHDADQLAM